MTFNLTRKTNSNAKLRIIAVNDPAIDWKQSFPEIQGDTEEGTEEERKKSAYQDGYDASKIFAKPGETLMYFELHHPRRIDIYRKIQSILLDEAGIGKKKTERDLFTEALNVCYIGSTEDPAAEAPEVMRDKNGKLPLEFLQALLDADLLNVLGAVVMHYVSRPPVEAHSEKK